MEGAFKTGRILTVGSSEELLACGKGFDPCATSRRETGCCAFWPRPDPDGRCDICEVERLAISSLFGGNPKEGGRNCFLPLPSGRTPWIWDPHGMIRRRSRNCEDCFGGPKDRTPVRSYASCSPQPIGSAARVLTDLLLERRPNKPILCCFSSRQESGMMK